jgi:NAD(P)-dependent dehydrogenase (short-subunit alcohol dehydrogenase family)
MSLAGAHILIVGGTEGIGRATAIAALAAGARVTATGRSAKSVAKLPDNVAGAVLDFTDPASVAGLVEGLEPPDHLVLSASDAVAWGGFAEIAEDALRAAFDAKFRGYWRVIRALAPKTPAHGSSRLSPARPRAPPCPEPRALRPSTARSRPWPGCWPSNWRRAGSTPSRPG